MVLAGPPFVVVEKVLAGWDGLDSLTRWAGCVGTSATTSSELLLLLLLLSSSFSLASRDFLLHLYVRQGLRR